MFRFDFAISYASEEAGLAGDLYSLLCEKEIGVFFALDEQIYLWGKPLKRELKNNFGVAAKFCIPLVSLNYVGKYWTRFELDVSLKERSKRDYEFILPIKIDDADLQRLGEDVVYIDLRKMGIFKTVDIMIEKLRNVYPVEEKLIPKHWVATFGVNISDLVQNYELPHGAPEIHPLLCDWLQHDLMERLSKSAIQEVGFIDDYQDGEILTIRVGFEWDPSDMPLDFGNLLWWEVLEVEEFQIVYPETN